MGTICCLCCTTTEQTSVWTSAAAGRLSCKWGSPWLESHTCNEFARQAVITYWPQSPVREMGVIIALTQLTGWFPQDMTLEALCTIQEQQCSRFLSLRLSVLVKSALLSAQVIFHGGPSPFQWDEKGHGGTPNYRTSHGASLHLTAAFQPRRQNAGQW